MEKNGADILLQLAFGKEAMEAAGKISDMFKGEADQDFNKSAGVEGLSARQAQSAGVSM
jgi:hypothetical protein